MARLAQDRQRWRDFVPALISLTIMAHNNDDDEDGDDKKERLVTISRVLGVVSSHIKKTSSLFFDIAVQEKL